MSVKSYKEALELIGENKAELTKLGVDEIGVFGSYVRNEQKTRSDVDIVVTFKAGKLNIHNYMEAKRLLESILKHSVDLVIKSDIKPALRKPILSSVMYA
jgi:hypothetical protein